MCYQFKVSLTDGWTSYDDVSWSSVMRRHGDRDETSDVDVVFDAMNSAARTPVSHSDVQVMFD